MFPPLTFRGLHSGAVTLHAGPGNGLEVEPQHHLEGAPANLIGHPSET
jgi:hypothetical protein